MIINSETLCRFIFVVLVVIIFTYGFVLVTLVCVVQGLMEVQIGYFPALEK